jgi:hypothetical protein
MPTWWRTNAVALLTLAIVAWLAVSLVRALIIASRRRQSILPKDASHAERVRADIRRKIAERKDAPVRLESPCRAANAARTAIPPIDPFGGRRRRGWGRAWEWLRTRLRR